MNRMELNKISSKRKGNRTIDRLNISLNSNKYIENYFFHSDNNMCIEKSS